MSRFAVALLIGMIAAAAATAGEDAKSAEDSTVVVSLRDGSRLHGTIVEENSEYLTVKTAGGLEARVPKSSVVTIERLRGRVVEGEFRRTDPNYSRLLYAPTGYPLRAGNGYFADHYVFFPSLAYGITDNISILGGMSLLPGAGIDEQLWYIAPRIGTRITDESAVSIGTLLMGVSDEHAGIAFAMGTAGPPDANFSAGFGIPYSGTDVAEAAIVIFGLNRRITNSAAFVAENWFVFGDGEFMYMLGPAIRFFGDRLAGDFGILIPKGVEALVPWLSITYNFGR